MFCAKKKPPKGGFFVAVKVKKKRREGADDIAKTLCLRCRFSGRVK